MQCLRFPGSVRESEDVIRWEIGEQAEDIDNLIDSQAKKLGLEARRLADDLCRRYGFPPFRRWPA